MRCLGADDCPEVACWSALVEGASFTRRARLCDAHKRAAEERAYELGMTFAAVPIEEEA